LKIEALLAIGVANDIRADGVYYCTIDGNIDHNTDVLAILHFFDIQHIILVLKSFRCAKVQLLF